MRRTNYSQPAVQSGPDSQSSSYSEDEDEDIERLRDLAPIQDRRQREVNRPRPPPEVNQRVVRRDDHPPPFPQAQESRQNAKSKPVEEQRPHASFDPRYVDTASAGLSQQQSASYPNMGQFTGNTQLHSSNTQFDQSHHPTYYGHQGQTPGYGNGQWNYIPPGSTALQYQPPPMSQHPNYQFLNLPPHLWPMQYPPAPPTPPRAPTTAALANAPPRPPPDEELLALKEELKAMRELTKRAKEAEEREKMEEQIRKEVEDEFQYQMERAKEAQERARDEIEKIRTEAEIATRKKILAERHAEAERERLETQQAIRFEREVRLKIERERVAEEAAKEARARQREQYEVLMREKMLQSMEELTAMAKGKMMREFGAEKEPRNKGTNVERNYETDLGEMSAKKQKEKTFSDSGVNQGQKIDAEVEKQEVCRHSSDAGDVSEQQTSTPGSESQKLHNQYHSRFPGGNDTIEEQGYSNRESLESRVSPEYPSTASIDSEATHFSFKKVGAHEDRIPPPAPDISSVSNDDDRKSSSSRSSHLSSDRPRRNTRAYSTYSDYRTDEEHPFYPGYDSYPEYHRYQDSYQERYPYQEYHREHHPDLEHEYYQGHRREDYSYPVSNLYPMQMGELVEQIIDGVLSRLQVVSGPHSDSQNAQPSPHRETFPRVETVFSVSASDVKSAHSEAATLQSPLCESTCETSIIDGHVSDARLTIDGRVFLTESNLPNSPETGRPQTQIHIDVAAVTAVAACYDEEEFHTPTEIGEPEIQAYIESSIVGTDKDKETVFLQPSSESYERPACWRRSTLMCQSCGRLTMLCKCPSVSHDS